MRLPPPDEVVKGKEINNDGPELPFQSGNEDQAITASQSVKKSMNTDAITALPLEEGGIGEEGASQEQGEAGGARHQGHEETAGLHPGEAGDGEDFG
jgi:hypothetical protein